MGVLEVLALGGGLAAELVIEEGALLVGTLLHLDLLVVLVVHLQHRIVHTDIRLKQLTHVFVVVVGGDTVVAHAIIDGGSAHDDGHLILTDEDCLRDGAHVSGHPPLGHWRLELFPQVQIHVALPHPRLGGVRRLDVEVVQGLKVLLGLEVLRTLLLLLQLDQLVLEGTLSGVDDELLDLLQVVVELLGERFDGPEQVPLLGGLPPVARVDGFLDD
mmetsp:Transcript_847/g.888  ORF Transcript_847/g.888 Transcript_847/m.888 type:complete len:216 (-) Transcript_847:2054-2701(-)